MPNTFVCSSAFFPSLKTPDCIYSAESLMPINSRRADTLPEVTRDLVSWIYLNILLADQNTDLVKSGMWMCTFCSSYLSWDVSHEMRSRAELVMWESLLLSLYASLLLVSISMKAIHSLWTPRAKCSNKKR